MTRRYAQDTTVPVERSYGELQRLLRGRGATGFGQMWQGNVIAVRFELDGRNYLFRLRMPAPTAKQVTHTVQNQARSKAAAQQAWEQEERRLWRALILVVKAKLESVDSGLETMEQAFLANLMLPSGETVGQWIEPQIAATYSRNEMPPMLPGGDDEYGEIRALPSGR